MNSRPALTPAAASIADDAGLREPCAAAAEPAVRDQLILRYWPLVHSVVARLGVAGQAEYDDLVGHGTLGLIHAVDRFDPTRGVRFSTFATRCIQGRVLDGLRSLDPLSQTARRRLRQIEAAAGMLQAQLKRAPGEAELAAHTGLGIAAVRSAQREASRVTFSLDAAGGPEADLHDVLASDAEDPLEVLLDGELTARLRLGVAGLPRREQQILAMRYQEGLPLNKIAARLRLTEARVSQLHARAVQTLKDSLEQDDRPRLVN
jgi:RNA polymerase sigma factor for flagellar operon FliA